MFQHPIGTNKFAHTPKNYNCYKVLANNYILVVLDVLAPACNFHDDNAYYRIRNIARQKGGIVPQLESILYDKKDLIATVTINRPEHRNTITIDLCRDLWMAMEEARDDPGVGVVILTGAGDKFFCPGLDLNYARNLFNNTDDVYRLNNEYCRAVYSIRYMGKPVIARINGITAGGGCEWTIATDLAIAADHAKFQQGEGGVGAIATYATQSVALLMGDKRARWFMFTDEVVDAKTAVEIGLINKAVPHDKLDEEIDSVCQNLLNKAPWSLRFTKDQMNVWFDIAYTTLRQGNDFWSLQSTTPEPLEGIGAFLEKRTPDYLALRRKAASGTSHTFRWGPPTKACPSCKVNDLPADFEFCGKCGTRLTGA